MNGIPELVGSIGVPAAIAFFLLWRMERTLQKMLRSLLTIEERQRIQWEIRGQGDAQREIYERIKRERQGQ